MRLAELAALIGGELKAGKGGGPDLDIKGVSPLEAAQEGDITFAADKRRVREAGKSKASCIMLGEYAPELSAAQLIVANPYFAFARALEIFYVKPYVPGGISALAYIDEGANIGQEVTVHPFAHVSRGASVGSRTVLYPGVFVGEGSKVGEDCILYPNVVLREGVAVGNRVIIHAGAVIGSDGFGYVWHEGKHNKIPQVGGVVIGDDVEIGANVTVDRATLGETAIGRGTKIDNLVQIAHNVTVGEDAIIVALTGIAGSCSIGNSVIIGAQVGIADHVRVNDGARVASQSGLMREIPAGGAYAGTPAMPHREWLKSVSIYAKLPALSRRIAELEEKLKELERRLNGGD